MRPARNEDLVLLQVVYGLVGKLVENGGYGGIEIRIVMLAFSWYCEIGIVRSVFLWYMTVMMVMKCRKISNR